VNDVASNTRQRTTWRGVIRRGGRSNLSIVPQPSDGDTAESPEYSVQTPGALTQLWRRVEWGLTKLDLAWAKLSHDQDQLVENLLYLGSLSGAGGDLNGAEVWYQRAYSAAQRSGNEAGRSKAAWGIALTYFNRHEYQRVVTDLDRELPNIRGLQDRRLLAEGLQTLGIAYEKLGQAKLASDLYAESLAVATDIGDDTRRALAMRLLGGCRYIIGDWSGARKHWSESLALFRTRNDNRGVAMMAFWLGILAVKESQFDEAHQLVAESLAIYRRIGPAELAARAMRALDGIDDVRK
jgi:tetratricopeptide (TPR) repeat protein